MQYVILQTSDQTQKIFYENKNDNKLIWYLFDRYLARIDKLKQENGDKEKCTQNNKMTSWIW
jgi:hypothetical protein